jgi:hypothetical protein
MADGSVDVERYELVAGVRSDPTLLEALFCWRLIQRSDRRQNRTPPPGRGLGGSNPARVASGPLAFYDRGMWVSAK